MVPNKKYEIKLANNKFETEFMKTALAIMKQKINIVKHLEQTWRNKKQNI